MASSPSKRVVRLRALLIFGGLVLFGFVALLWWYFNSEFMAIDRCLDSGGRWAEGDVCEGGLHGV